MRAQHLTAAWLTVAFTLLLGCADADRPSSNATQPSQIIARVNGEEISLLQYRRALGLVRTQNPTEAVRQEIIDKLVDRELAVEQAIELRLDRQADVLVELEEARRDVLARAWAKRVAAEVPAPDDSAAARYYAERPYLFSERRVFHLREAALSSDRVHYTETRERMTRGDSITEILAWLKAQGVALKDQIVIRTAEQLPIEALPRLATTGPGKPAYFETPRGLLIYEVLESRAAPLDWDSARPVILAHLAKQAGKAAVVSEKQRLRRNADIHYAVPVLDPTSHSIQALQ
jgi:EpsD family peptidyl-prolyl cis-trans isomerase